jgi:hypothetical protein
MADAEKIERMDCLVEERQIGNEELLAELVSQKLTAKMVKHEQTNAEKRKSVTQTFLKMKTNEVMNVVGVEKLIQKLVVVRKEKCIRKLIATLQLAVRAETNAVTYAENHNSFLKLNVTRAANRVSCRVTVQKSTQKIWNHSKESPQMN